MLNDKWEDKHGITLPAHTSCLNNMVLQPLQGLSDNDNRTGSSSQIDVATLTSSGSNLQEGRYGLLINQPTSVEPVSFNHQFGNQFHQQNNVLETGAGPSLVNSNLQQLITFLSSNYGPMNTPLEVGSPEYMKLVEILNQRSVNGEDLSGGLKEIGSYSKERETNTIQNVETASLTENKSSTDRNNHAKISSEKTAEQLWEGSLQLSSSVTLSAVAFFKSGEKLVGNNWPEFIEVKGKVRMEAFEKYVQDLPRSRNRGLMVVSICWNEGSSNIGLNGMKEVAKGYKKSSRVGFAHLLSGTDLYICPRSDPIITILAKYGFFKGMSVIDDKPDSMIGCVVWRKNRPPNVVGNTSDGKSSSSLAEPQDSPPGFSSKQRTEQKLSPEKSESSQRHEPLTLPSTLVCAEVDRNVTSSSSNSSPLQNLVSSDPAGNLVLKKRPFEDDDLPEFDFSVPRGKSTSLSKPLNSPEKLDNFRPTQLPSVLNAVERNNNNNVGQSPAVMNVVDWNNNNNSGQVPAVMNAIERNNNNNSSLKQPIKKTKLFDDDDMPEWCPPPELHNQPLPHVMVPTSQNLPSHPPCLPLPLPPPPPIPPGPPPPQADSGSLFSYQPFRSPVSSQPPVFVRPPPPPPRPLPQPPPRSANWFRPPPPPQQPLPPPPPFSSAGRFSHNNGMWHQPPFPSSNERRPQL